MSKTNKHRVTNKLKHQVRSRRIWHMRIEKDRKREQKKRERGIDRGREISHNESTHTLYQRTKKGYIIG